MSREARLSLAGVATILSGAALLFSGLFAADSAPRVLTSRELHSQARGGAPGNWFDVMYTTCGDIYGICKGRVATCLNSVGCNGCSFGYQTSSSFCLNNGNTFGACSNVTRNGGCGKLCNSGNCFWNGTTCVCTGANCNGGPCDQLFANAGGPCL